MSEFVRLYRYQSILSSRRAVPTQELLSTLEISLATFKRDLAKMRDQLGMPIVFDRDRGGYVLQGDGASPLPGMWFTPQELVALATIQQLLVQLQPGLLAETLGPIKLRLAELLKTHGLNEREMVERVRIVHAGKRDVLPQSLEAAASATMRRRRLRFVHFNRQTGERVEREVSPQRLVLYRDNWYLDAWCHLRKDVRSFSIDAVESAVVLDQQAKDIDLAALRKQLDGGYGIFGGVPKDWAELTFSAVRAGWVRHEVWHPQQQGILNSDGSYTLRLPYSDERELIGDILRHGADVTVKGPTSLRRQVQEQIERMRDRYR